MSGRPTAMGCISWSCGDAVPTNLRPRRHPQDCAPIRGLLDSPPAGRRRPGPSPPSSSPWSRTKQTKRSRNRARPACRTTRSRPASPRRPTSRSSRTTPWPCRRRAGPSPTRTEARTRRSTRPRPKTASNPGPCLAVQRRRVHVLLLQIQPFRPSLVPLTAQDCAPIRGLQDFAADRPPDRNPHDSLEFRAVENGQAKTVTKTGKTCRQDYTLKTGIPNKTNLEIIKNYAEALPQEGWTFTNREAGRGRRDLRHPDQGRRRIRGHLWPSNGDSVHVALLQIAPFKSSLKAAQTVEPPPPHTPTAHASAAAPPPPAGLAELTLPAPAATPSRSGGPGRLSLFASVPGSTADRRAGRIRRPSMSSRPIPSSRSWSPMARS